MSALEEEQVKLLREILKWERFTGMKEVKAALESTLDTDQKKTAYQASDGSRGTREVARISGYGSKSTIERLWKIWRRLGLGETSPVQGSGERFTRSFDLEDFGIEVPEMPTTTQASQPSLSSGETEETPNA